MALTSDGVAKVANLARLHLSAAEESQFTDKLNTILGMIDVLAQADTSHVAPLAHPLEATQPLRADAVSEHNQREAYQAIAPAVEAGLYLVPKVIE